SFGDGTWTDPTKKAYVVPGLENAAANSSGIAWFKVEAWTGPATSYPTAVATGAPSGESPPFQNPWASLPNLTPDLVGMPSIIFPIPEPGMYALAGLGAISFLFFLRKASPQPKSRGDRPRKQRRTIAPSPPVSTTFTNAFPG